MSAIRRQGVIAQYGSLKAYRAYLIEGRYQTSRRLHVWEPMADDELARYRADLHYQIMDWQCDIDWVDAELASKAVAA